MVDISYIVFNYCGYTSNCSPETRFIEDIVENVLKILEETLYQSDVKKENSSIIIPNVDASLNGESSITASSRYQSDVPNEDSSEIILNVVTILIESEVSKEESSTIMPNADASPNHQATTKVTAIVFRHCTYYIFIFLMIFLSPVFQEVSHFMGEKLFDLCYLMAERLFHLR